MKRDRFQGVLNVVRFNWPFFVIAGATTLGFLVAGIVLQGAPSTWAFMAAVLVTAGLLVPLAATWYAYDLSGLYALQWLDPIVDGRKSAANIHAGFDETTALLQSRYPKMEWRVFDFYDPDKHTEPSIRRAREAHPLPADTIPIRTCRLPAETGEFDLILLFLAAHEIRETSERETFFKELRRCLSPAGRIVVVEHHRDVPNVLVYGLGAWHFHTRRIWETVYASAGLRIDSISKINALITCHILSHD